MLVNKEEYLLPDTVNMGEKGEKGTNKFVTQNKEANLKNYIWGYLVISLKEEDDDEDEENN